MSHPQNPDDRLRPRSTAQFDGGVIEDLKASFSTFSRTSPLMMPQIDLCFFVPRRELDRIRTILSCFLMRQSKCNLSKNIYPDFCWVSSVQVPRSRWLECPHLRRTLRNPLKLVPKRSIKLRSLAQTSSVLTLKVQPRFKLSPKRRLSALENRPFRKFCGACHRTGMAVLTTCLAETVFRARRPRYRYAASAQPLP